MARIVPHIAAVCTGLRVPVPDHGTRRAEIVRNTTGPICKWFLVDLYVLGWQKIAVPPAQCPMTNFVLRFNLIARNLIEFLKTVRKCTETTGPCYSTKFTLPRNGSSIGNNDPYNSVEAIQV